MREQIRHDGPLPGEESVAHPDLATPALRRDGIPVSAGAHEESGGTPADRGFHSLANASVPDGIPHRAGAQDESRES